MAPLEQSESIHEVGQVLFQAVSANPDVDAPQSQSAGIRVERSCSQEIQKIHNFCTRVFILCLLKYNHDSSSPGV